MTLDDTKDACEMVETVKDRAEHETGDAVNEETFHRDSKSLARKLDMTLMPTVRFTFMTPIRSEADSKQIWLLSMFNYLDRNNIR